MDVVERVKDIASLVKKYNDQELYEQIVALREEILLLRESNLGLKERLNELSRQSEIHEQLSRKGNTYVQSVPAGEERGPFCMACWDYDRKLVNLAVRRYSVRGQPKESMHCAICNARKTSAQT